MKKEIIITILCFAVMLFGGLFAGEARAATLTVTKTDDTNDNVCNGDCSLREAMFAAASGDTIEFASPFFDTPRTIRLSSSYGTLYSTKNLTINGRGREVTVISGELINGAIFYNFNGADVTINGLTFTGSISSYAEAGGIKNDFRLTINNCSVTGNKAGDGSGARGGGIFNKSGGVMTINNSVVAGNEVSGDSTVISYGGGIYNAGTMTVTGSVIKGNRAIQNSGTPLTRVGYGGGIYNFGGYLTITISEVSENYLNDGFDESYGGGIASWGGYLTINNSTISGNSASIRRSWGRAWGGGIYNKETNLTLTNVTIATNRVSNGDNSGGGIHNLSGRWTSAVNSIISGNSASSGANLAGTLDTNVNNFVDGDARLAPLAGNGGRSQTHALLSDSPALNAGNICVLNVNGCGNGNPALTTDQRGVARPQGGGIDIGAFERMDNGFVHNANSWGAGSLRQAISETAEGGTIRFDPNYFNQPRTIIDRLDIFKNLTIIGPGSGLLTIDGDNGGRVLNIDGPTVTISGIRFTRGKAGDGVSAGGILINGGGTLNATDIIVENCSAGIHGGGIYNTGTLNLIDSTVRGNTAGLFGGGIYNDGVTMTIIRSTISGNTGWSGGGLYANALSVVNNSTLSGNTAAGGGGAVFIPIGKQLDTTNTTITNNVSSNNQIGGIYNQGLYRTRNAIIAGNRNLNGAGNGDLNGDVASYGWNLFGNTIGTNIYSTGMNGQTLTGNLYNVAANLAPLSNYGGATETHALLQNSPAINAASDAFTTDQRGASRKIGSAVDIGAFEQNISFNQNSILPAANRNSAYNQQLSVSRQNSFLENGVFKDFLTELAATNFEIVPVTGESLPAGITLSSTGLLSGTTSQTGTFTFTVKATDMDGQAGAQQFSLQVAAVPTAASVSIGGRILTNQNRGLRNALVSLADQSGNSRTVLSGINGNYRFADVQAGQTYVITVASKKYLFSPQIITVTEEATNLDFTAQD